MVRSRNFIFFIIICISMIGLFLKNPFATQATEDGPIYYTNKVAVLMYHHLDEYYVSPWTIKPTVFAEHLQLLEEKYNVISIEEMKDWLQNGQEIPANAVVLTFDDGYESYYTYAYPLLKERNMPAVHFLIVHLMDQQPFLQWEQIREMAADGYTFYSHSYDQHHQVTYNSRGATGPALTNRRYLPEQKRLETYSEYRQRIYADLKKGKEILEQELGENHQEVIFSYPFGAGNTVTEEVLQDLGYESIVTTKKGLTTKLTSPKRIFRIDVGKPDIDAKSVHQLIMEQVK